VPDDLSLPPAEALDMAQAMLDTGRPFQAHEVLEASWKSAPAAERDLWQGLAQVAVGLTHAQRGNARGAAALLRRGAARVAGYSGGPAPHGIDVRGVTAAADALARRADQAGVSGLTAADLRLRLRTELYRTAAPCRRARSCLQPVAGPGEAAVVRRSSGWIPAAGSSGRCARRATRRTR
jgi:hypothetical protein